MCGAMNFVQSTAMQTPSTVVNNSETAATHEVVLRRLHRAAEAVRLLTTQAAVLETICNVVRETLERDGLIATAGNGGSAAEALHLAEELVGRYERNRKPLRAVCLCADPTAMSCIANDYGFDEVFARQATAVLRRGDLLVLFSTSGNSANLLSAASAAKARGAKVLGILGKGGGKLLPLCDFSIVVGGEDSAMIQEAHQIIMHAVCEVADRIAPTDA